MITVDNVVTEISGNPVNAPISFHLEAGQLGILLGGNGSGKTSILRAILAELRIASGSIEVCGQHFQFGQTWQLTRSIIRTIPQFPILPDCLTIAEYLKAWNRYRTTSSSDISLDHLTKEIQQISGQYSESLLGTLSYGQKRLIDIILSLEARPHIILADEPLSGLSQHIVRWCVHRLNDFKRKGGTLLVVAHKPEQQFWDADWNCEVYPA